MATQRVQLNPDIVLPPPVPEFGSVTSVNVTEAAVVFVTSRSAFGNIKVASKQPIQVNCDKALLQVQKKLLDCKELRAVTRCDNQFDAYIHSRSLPSLYKRSASLLPVKLAVEMDERVQEYIVERKELVDIFVDRAYELAVKATQERLGDLANPKDYPDKETMRGLFTFSYNYQQYGNSPLLKTINRAMWEREQQRAEEHWKDATASYVQLLRRKWQELVTYMVDLTSTAEADESGKKKRKVFRKTSLDKMNDFLGTADALNLAGDADLKRFVANAKDILSGVTPEILKSDDALRDSVNASFASIKTELAGLVTDEPIRSIRF
jgi:hypothetical protein